MIHSECGFCGSARKQCPSCGMFWYPRCRKWSSPPGDTGKKVGDG